MLAVISPAKTLDFQSQCPSVKVSQPDFLDDSEELVGVLRRKSRAQIRALMDVSEKLAEQNFERYQDWQRPFSEDNARPALLAFKGDVYTGFTLEEYTARDFTFAQKHLRILSGLYGLLRPLDLIQAYRLEMGTQLKTARGKNLYAFWDAKITHALKKALDESGSRILVNLASNEYYSSVETGGLDAQVITPMFKDLKNGQYKFVSYWAKKARGMMCDFMIQNRLKKPEGLKDFDRDGYSFNKGLSEGNNWVFTRDVPPVPAGRK